MNKNQNDESKKQLSEQNNNFDKFKAQKMRIFLGTNVLLRELTPFIGKGKSFENLLTVGICGLLHALEECHSFDSFDEKIKEYAELYLSKYIKNSDYCPELMDIARDMLISNISIAETLSLGNSVQQFAKEKIDSLTQQYRNKPLVLRKAVYVSCIDTIIHYPRRKFSKSFKTAEAFMLSRIEHHLDLNKQINIEVK